LLCQHWWQHATRQVPGTEPHHEDVVAFLARQYLDWMAPSNQPWSNPQVLEHTLRQGGMNLLRGAAHASEDLVRRLGRLPPAGSEAFAPGRNLACTPGKVVLRNALVELIQYQPETASVYAEPVLLVPAWIMKFYILDLTPESSLVHWLVARGHTVFCLSWRNVTARQRQLGMDDYRRLGVMAALDAIGHIVPGQRVHALGYCLGGTLLALAAAAMAHADDRRLATLTLLAAQTDFTEPGELQLFIDASQVRMLDSMMALRGYLTAEQMSMAFQMLRSTDLIWSRMVHEYMLGERLPMSALQAWNADSTRMPERMHSEYLHSLFLHNDLAAGRFLVHGRPAALQNLRLPIFAVGAEGDHVAPWRSVYKIHYLTDTEVCFVLASGGHNAGIVSPPTANGPPGRHFRYLRRRAEDSCLSPAEWLDAAPLEQGSWWPQWGLRPTRR
jgi:polyhydroxyalkanoate synthase